MKVLWITTSDTFYNQGNTATNSYNGVGWVAAQQLEIMRVPEISLGIMFLTPQRNAEKRIVDDVTYLPIIDSPSKFSKLIRYYHSPNKDFYNRIKPQIEAAVNDFKPDIIHIFGIECPLSNIILSCNIPHIIHLQGLLEPCKEAFFPPGISNHSINRYGSFLREVIIRNGFNYAYRQMIRGAEREKILWSHIKHATGRTYWDNAMQELYAPQCKYYHIDEILRPEFYHALQVPLREVIDKIQIVSTISPTLYKGLDLILKTAKILRELKIDYDWNIIGISSDSSYEKIIRKSLNIMHDTSIHFLGIKDASGIISELHKADIYIHPSFIDNSPNSLCEAQMVGIPVIATNVGGVNSLIHHNEDGILVPSNEPHILSHEIIRISNNYILRKSLANNGRNTAIFRHDKNKIISQITSLYHTILENPN